MLSYIGQYNAAIHVGDIAYDMYVNNGQRGDAFMEQIEPIASMVSETEGWVDCPVGEI